MYRHAAIITPNLVTVFFAIGVLVVGILAALHEIDTSPACTGANAGTDEHDDLNQRALAAGIMFITAAVFAAIGGICGACAGCADLRRAYAEDGPGRKRRLFITSAIFLFLGMLVLIWGGLVAGLGFQTSNGICGDKTCNGPTAPVFATGTVAPGINTTTITTTAYITTGLCVADSDKNKIYCSVDFDNFCDFRDKASAALGVGVICFVVMVWTIIVVLGACWCCPRCYNRFIPDAPDTREEAQRERYGNAGTPGEGDVEV